MKSVSAAPKRTKSSWLQAMAWLAIALIVGVLTFILWMASLAPSMQPQEVAQTEGENTKISLDFSKVTHVDNLNELRKEVKPISFDALVRDLRNYPDEFKDKSYLKQHEKDWTVQVMDVAEHEVITDYLEGRDDRDKFAYFRYRDENDSPRYILTYDTMNTPQLAMGTAKVIDFKLPENVRVLPEQMARYLSIIENYELSAPVEDISTNSSRRVRLKPARREIPPPQAEAQKKQEVEDVALETDETTTTDTETTASTKTSIADSNDANDTLNVNVARTSSTSSRASDVNDTVAQSQGTTTTVASTGNPTGTNGSRVSSGSRGSTVAPSSNNINSNSNNNNNNNSAQVNNRGGTNVAGQSRSNSVATSRPANTTPAPNTPAPNAPSNNTATPSLPVAAAPPPSRNTDATAPIPTTSPASSEALEQIISNAE